MRKLYSSKSYEFVNGIERRSKKVIEKDKKKTTTNRKLVLKYQWFD